MVRCWLVDGHGSMADGFSSGEKTGKQNDCVDAFAGATPRVLGAYDDNGNRKGSGQSSLS